jgi:ornithine--oxo-acid transaminase
MKEMVDKYYANIYSSLPVVLSKGKGVYVWDEKGKKYFDCLSCYSAVNQGHRHPKIIRAAKKQMDRLTLTSMAFYNDKLGDFLKEIAHQTMLDKIILKNSGAEAVEASIKAMRRWGHEVKGVENPKIIVMDNNFHGRTTTIVGFSSDEESRKGFGPYSDGFVSVPFGNYKAVEEAIEEDKNIVGVLVEPIQGEAGVIIPPDDFLPELYLTCKRYGVLLAVDEIQTGLGRTGSMLCHVPSYYGFFWPGISTVIKPDIIILGKALSGGVYPISACCMTKEVADVFRPGSDGSTYGGNPLAAAIGLAAIEVIKKEKLCDNSNTKGTLLYSFLTRITKNNERVKEVRGKGLFIAIEFHKPVAKEACSKLMDKGILAKDTHGTTIRFAPPLTIKDKELDELLNRLEEFIYEFTY